jgi:myo-inositol-1(or 4)-monophosphatase
LQAISGNDRSNTALLEVVLDAARSAASVIRDSTADRDKLVWETKGQSDFVSEVDKASEQCIAEIVRRRLPDATVLGEELSPTAIASKGLVVIADPLDGTTNFLHGYPEYSVSIAVAREGVLAAGAVVNVPSGDEFTATRNGGAFLNGKPIKVSKLREPSRALVGTGFPFKEMSRADLYMRQLRVMMEKSSGVRRAGAAALDLAYVACGRLDGFWELGLSPWDMAAGALLILEAGGLVGDLDGEQGYLEKGDVCAAAPKVFTGLLQALK